MLTSEQIDNWDVGYDVDKKDIILDLYSMHLWSSDNIPWKALIPMLKQESGSTSSLYEIATLIADISKDNHI